MVEDFQLRNFTEKDLDDFGQIEKIAENIPLVKDSLEFILRIEYGFKKYLIDKLLKNGKLKLMIGGKNIVDGILVQSFNLKEIFDVLNIKDRRFILKLNNLKQFYTTRLDLHQTYLNLDIRNSSGYLLKEHHNLDENIIEESLIWLSDQESCELLIRELQKNKFIDETGAAKALSIFCDKFGTRFSTGNKEKIRWCGLTSELSFMISLLAGSQYKLVSDREIWLKCSKCFQDKNYKNFKPGNLSVSSQKGNPKSKRSIISILEKVKSSSITFNS